MNTPNDTPGQGTRPPDSDLPAEQRQPETPPEPPRDDREGPHDDAGNPIQKL